MQAAEQKKDMDGIPIYVLKALACLQNQISHAHAIARTLATYSSVLHI